MPRGDVATGEPVTGDQAEILRRLQHARNYNAWLLERARPFLGERILDAGAGTGTFTDLLARGRGLVVALEPDETFATRLEERFRDRPNVDVLHGDTRRLDPRDFEEPFDSVVCFNVLEHIRDDAEAVAALRGVLAPGGHLLLLVPAHPGLYGSIDRTVGHERRYGKRQVRALLASNGLDVAELRLVNPLGALGWLVSGRLLRRRYIPEGPLRFYDRAVPLLRVLDRVEVGFGLSIWTVARRPS